jgi:hypothetical protein
MMAGASQIADRVEGKHTGGATDYSAERRAAFLWARVLSVRLKPEALSEKRAFGVRHWLAGPEAMRTVGGRH